MASRLLAKTSRVLQDPTLVKRRRRLFGTFVLSALILAGLWGWLRKPLPHPGAPGETPYLTFILIDGLSQAHFQRLFNAGQLPNMAKLAKQGTLIENGVSAFPSMTGYGFYPFLTARDASNSGILGLRWLDRARARGQIRNYVGRSNRRMNEDLASDPQTLFERVAPQHSYSINALVDRGVRRKVLTGWDFTMAKYREHWWLPRILKRLPLLGPRLAPDLHEAERRVLKQAIADLAHQPKLQWLSFTSPDAHAHIYGMDAGYDKLLKHVDSLIGEYRAASAAHKQEPDRIYALITDHGLVNVSGNVDLRVPLEHVGVRVDREEATRFWQAGLNEDVSQRLQNTDVVLLVNGNSLNYLYVRNPRSAANSGDFLAQVPREDLVAYPAVGRGVQNLLAAVLATQGVDQVISRDRHGRVIVETQTGSGTITEAHGQLAYAATGSDPLTYAKHTATREMMDGGFHSPQAWLAASVDTEFPDALLRLSRLFAHPNCGDVVVLGKAGFDLAADYERFVSNYRGGHGGLRAAELRVPYVLAGPGVASGVNILTARAEDVGATLFALLGLQPPDFADGNVLQKALQKSHTP